MKTKKLNKTKCWKCYAPLPFSDDELADDVILNHQLKDCNK